MWRRMRPAAVLAILGALIATGCGGGEEGPSAPPTRLERGLASVGTGAGRPAFATGWVDLARLRGAPRPARDGLAAALGGGASGAISAAESFARVGVRPLRARQALSVGGSYAFGFRLDGASAGRIPALLRRDGGQARESGAWVLIDTGAEGVRPQALLDAGVHAFGARVAVGPGLVLANSVDARNSLTGRGRPITEDPVTAAGAACLGDVLAAAVLPPEAAVSFHPYSDLYALGSRRDARGGWEEVLCVLDPGEEEAARTEAALQRAFAAGARDPVSGQPMREIARGFELDRPDLGADGEAVRVTLRLAPAEPPGLLFRALARGSLLAYLGYAAG